MLSRQRKHVLDHILTTAESRDYTSRSNSVFAAFRTGPRYN